MSLTDEQRNDINQMALNGPSAYSLTEWIEGLTDQLAEARADARREVEALSIFSIPTGDYIDRDAVLAILAEKEEPLTPAQQLNHAIHDAIEGKK